MTSLEEMTIAVRSFADNDDVMNAACLSAYPGDESYKCMFAYWALEFISAPTLVTLSVHDDWALNKVTGKYGPPYTEEQTVVVKEFAQATIDGLEAMENENLK